MKIAVIGAGAMGSIYASFLSKNNNEVLVIDIWEEHLEAIEKNNSELFQFKLTINKKYEEYSFLLSSQIDDDQNWSDAAITIDKLYFVEKLLHKINNVLN